MVPDNLRHNKAAAYLGLASATLAKMRMRGDGPEYIKAGKRLIIYRKSDLDAWLDDNRHRATAEYTTP